MSTIDKISCIYSITNLENGNRYIGSAVRLDKRRNIHLHHLRNNKHHSPYLQAAYNKYGEKAFKFEIVEKIRDKHQLIEKEQYWIDFLRPSYNINLKAGSLLGYRWSKEICKKHSDNIKNAWKDPIKRKNMLSNKDYSFTQDLEYRRKLSEKGKGRIVSSDTRRKISNTHIGLKASEETRNKISAAHKGKLKYYNRKTILITDTQTNISYAINGISECANIFNMNRGIIQYGLKSGRPILKNRFKVSYHVHN